MYVINDAHSTLITNMGEDLCHGVEHIKKRGCFFYGDTKCILMT